MIKTPCEYSGGGLKIGDAQNGNISTDAYRAQNLNITPTAISGFTPIACVSYMIHLATR